ncbi:transferase [Desulfobacter hydrogenophilus]|nr:transferase [Desulfobacter hydrogenophilus]NDY70477.1 transferase [Desulfobacter hydrogenophilus]
MILDLNEKELTDLMVKQLRALLCFNESTELMDLKKAIQLAIDKIAYLIPRCKNKYYFKNGAPYFTPFHSGQNTIFCYFVSHILYVNLGNENLAERIFYLNKILNGINIYYTTKLPDIFYLDHAVGTVIGKADFSDYFQFRQNVTVGNNFNKYPRFGRNVHLWSGATVIGDCNIGNNVIISARTYLKDQDIPDNSIVFGKYPEITIKGKDEDYFLNNNYFNMDIK